MGRRWTRSARNIISSLADVSGDWLFWYYTVRDNSLLEDYDIPVFIFAVVASTFGFLNIFSEFRKCNCRPKDELGYNNQFCCGPLGFACQWNKAQLAEIVLGDIAQIVLSVLIRLELAGWTPTLTLNLSTSVLNMCFDLLDITDDFLDAASDFGEAA